MLPLKYLPKPAQRSACWKPAIGSIARKNSKMFAWPYQAPHRAAGSTAKPWGYFDATTVGGWQVPGEPYTNAPGSDWMWWRARMLGGRTNHYGRISLRMGPYDFKPYSRDGKGFDWPITYDDLAPYYDKAEEFIGVFGTQEGLENTPDGKFQPAPRRAVMNVLIKHASDKLNIPCIPSRLAILTRPLNGRPACHYCAQCGTLLRRERKLQLARRAYHSDDEDRQSRSAHRRHGAGSAGRIRWPGHRRLLRGQENAPECRSARQDRRARRKLLRDGAHLAELESSRFPNGIANSSGLVGRYIMDTVGSSVSGHLPILQDLPPQNEDGVGGMHMYMPWWLYKEQKANKMPFARGYHIEFGGGRDQARRRHHGRLPKLTRRRLRRRAEARSAQALWRKFTSPVAAR